MEYRKYIRSRLFGHILSMPFIWAPLPVIWLLDILIEIYQSVCFPIYKIEKVKRSEYIQVWDRPRLRYLTWIEKLGCAYCGYANGWLPYAKEIAARTEKYWCGITHADKPGFKIQEHQIKEHFAEFGNKMEFDQKYNCK